MRLQNLLLAATLTIAPAIIPAFANDKTDVMAAVQQFDAGFNKGDMKTATGACAPDPIIIDDFPPHVWQGANACADWWNAYTAAAKADVITDPIVAIGKPHRVDVTGDRAYVVLYPKYTYKMAGKPVVENGSTWTMALQKTGTIWRITGWAWGQH